MRTPSTRHVIFSVATAVAVSIPVTVSLLNAQVSVCYIEWCIPKGAGETCLVKQVPCPPEPT